MSTSRRPAPAPDMPVREWLPFHHIDKACDLLDENIGQPHGSVSSWRVAAAQAHIAVAHAKMTGRQRA